MLLFRGLGIIVLLWTILFLLLWCHDEWTASAWKAAAWALLWAIVAGTLTTAAIFIITVFFN